jgi:ABC-type glycerol-3-phosphate transport system substrate-binding protein
MSVRGIWDVAFFADYAPKLDYDVALPPRPRDGVYVADWTYTDSTFILKSTKNPKESWEYVKWLNRVPDWPIYTRDLPARYDILAHPEFQKDKLFVKIADFAKYSKALLDFPALQFYKDKIDAAVNEAIFQKKTSREALAEMQTVVQREVDRVLKK